MDFIAVKKSSLKLFIGFLALTAAVAIVSVLSGEFGETQFKILSTCFTISVASIGSMACAAFIERKKRIRLGVLGILLTISGATLLIVGLWSETQNEEFWKAAATVSVIAIGFVHAFVLSFPELEARTQWVQRVAPVVIGLLAILIVLAIWLEIDSETYIRLTTVVSIIVVLNTVVIPILARIRKGLKETREREGSTLVLQAIGPNLFIDPDGTMYEVHPIADRSLATASEGVQVSKMSHDYVPDGTNDRPD